MRGVIGCMVILSICASTQVQAENTLSILQQVEGEIRKREVPLVTGWLALIEREGSHELVRANIRLLREADSSDPESVDLFTSDHPEAHYLIRDPALSPCKVRHTETTLTYRVPISPSGESLSVSLGGVQYEFQSELRDPNSPLNVGKFNHSVFLTQGTKKTLLHAWNEDIGPDAEDLLAWVGDLDGDGRLDMIIDFNTYGTSATCLFLSQPAKKGELVKRVGCDVSTA